MFIFSLGIVNPFLVGVLTSDYDVVVHLGQQRLHGTLPDAGSRDLQGVVALCVSLSVKHWLLGLLKHLKLVCFSVGIQGVHSMVVMA